MTASLRRCARLAPLARLARLALLARPAAVLAAAGMLAACSGTAVGTGTGPGSSGEESSPSGSSGGTVVGGGTDPGTGTKLPADAKIIFTTSSAFTGDLHGAVGTANAPTGAKAGDALCQLAAEGAQLSGTFKAFLTDDTQTALDRVTGIGPWYRPDGQKAFNNKAGLSSTPLARLDVDENGTHVSGVFAWVGGAGATCANWSLGVYSLSEQGGVTSLSGVRATNDFGCDSTYHLYCLQQ